jgi:hypothetical protein
VPPPSETRGTTEAPAGGIGSTGGDVLVATSTRTVPLWSSPRDGDARPAEMLSPAQQASGQVVCVVAQMLDDEWLQVYAPTAPAGHTGWVRRADITLSRHQFRIEVSLSDHMLTLHEGDREALSAPVAIGTVDSPDAGTTTFVKDLVQPPDPAGPYARYAFGLAGATNDVAAFEAGAGVVAIHGAADPATLGQDVPTGSIAVDPRVITRMVETIGLPLGTPVEIVE